MDRRASSLPATWGSPDWSPRTPGWGQRMSETMCRMRTKETQKKHKAVDLCCFITN